MRLAGIVSIACLAAQAAAFSKSFLTAANPVHCVVWPFGQCETIMASGYVALMGGFGSEHNLEAAVATFVPLMMWLTLVLSSHNPRLTMKEGDARKISPGGWMYILLLLVVLAISGMTITTKPTPTKIGAASNGSATSGEPRHTKLSTLSV